MKTPEKNYYSILEIDRNANEREIRKAYLKLVKKYHPDSKSSGNEADSEKFQSVIDAYKVLSDSKLRSDYNQTFFGYQRAEKKKDPSIEAINLRAEKLFNEGIEAYRIGDYNRAIEFLHIAVNLNPSNPLYLSSLGLAFSKKKRRLHEARNWCAKAVKLDPYNSIYHSNLASVYQGAGLYKVAHKYFKQALKLDPENQKAKEGLRLLGESDGLKDNKIFGFIKKAFTKREKD